MMGEIAQVKITEMLAVTAGELAARHDLRGYDAVHLAAALVVADPDTVLATGDRGVGAAARSDGLAVALTT